MDKKTQQNRRLGPDYALIYRDLIRMKFPHLYKEFEQILERDELNHFDIEHFNDKLFKENTHLNRFKQKYKAYDKKTILKILQYGKKHQLNNTQLARHFNLSRNTVTKWKKMFINW